jgi:hypothetical protein
MKRDGQQAIREETQMQKGKMTVVNTLVVCVLVVAGAMLFKYAVSRIDQKQIKKEIFDEMGVFRGPQLTQAKFESIVAKALAKRSLEPAETSFEISGKGIVSFYYQYEQTVDYFLFKRTEIVEVDDVMENYGG